MFAYNLKHEVNVRVDFLYANWESKRRALVDLLGTVLILIPFSSWHLGDLEPGSQSWASPGASARGRCRQILEACRVRR